MAKNTAIFSDTKNGRVYFTNHDDAIDLPNLVNHQNQSFQWFIDEGLGELLAEISPIDDYTGAKLTLNFLSYHFDAPKITEIEARENNISYDAPLKALVELTNKVTGEVKQQEIYLGDYPWMTSRGTFVINGAERVVVSQLIRSSGVFFTAERHGTTQLYGAKVIPGRGAWLEFETASNGAIYVKIDRKRKISITTLLQALGMTEVQIKEAFRPCRSRPD
jgi:DNA-directed RNA polymerase subunit beta